jgi:hypothetical protein
MPPYIYDTASRIILASQLWTASFDPNFGGTMMSLARAGSPQNVIWDHAGAAASIYFNGGNDPTLASHNGIGYNQIQQFRKEHRPRAQVRETEYSDNAYAVAGSIPYFWLSHEYFDDFIPNKINRWQTLYNNIKPELAQYAFAWDSPIYFIPSSEQLAGSIFVGNENKQGEPHQTLTSSFSLHTRIAFRGNFDRHDGNVASIIATNEGNEGIRFDLNANKKWAVLNKGKVLFAGTVPQLENRIELVLDNQLVALYINDKPFGVAPIDQNFSPLKREFGLQARMINANGFIEFTERKFVDLDEKIKLRHSVADDGALLIEAEAYSRNALYRTNLPQIFLNPDLIKRRVTVLKTGEHIYDQDRIEKLKDVAVVYTGLIEGTHGLMAYDFKSECKDLNGNEFEGHLLVGTNIIGLNNLPYSANQSPVFVKDGICKMSSRWKPYYDEAITKKYINK